MTPLSEDTSHLSEAETERIAADIAEVAAHQWDHDECDDLVAAAQH